MPDSQQASDISTASCSVTQFVKYAVCCNAVMQAAASRVTAAGTQGSSTCCIVLVDTLHGRLASANVGDSGFMILGVTHNNPKPHVKFRTPQQEHQFGCPYQLGHHQAADPPEEAMLTALPVSLSVDPAL
jgi:protein phosphatase PTC7